MYRTTLVKGWRQEQRNRAFPDIYNVGSKWFGTAGYAAQKLFRFNSIRCRRVKEGGSTDPRRPLSIAELDTFCKARLAEERPARWYHVVPRSSRQKNLAKRGGAPSYGDHLQCGDRLQFPPPPALHTACIPTTTSSASKKKNRPLNCE